MSTPPLSGFLAEMAAASSARAAALVPSQHELRARAADAPPAPRLVFESFDLIAEIKLSSPAEGALAEADVHAVGARAEVYSSAGAAAISVLTEPTRFGGSLQHLEAASAAARRQDVPVLRKDFLVDPLQVVEASAHGAGGVLLVARIVDDTMLARLLETARELELFALLEAFDAADLERILALVAKDPGPADSTLVGVNARDLRTLRVDAGRQRLLSRRLPADLPCVAESGILTARDAAAAAQAGYGLVLVGTALMRAPDPGRLARALLSAGRGARQGCTTPARLEVPR